MQSSFRSTNLFLEQPANEENRLHVAMEITEVKFNLVINLEGN